MIKSIYLLDDDPVISSLIKDSLQIENTEIKTFSSWDKLEKVISNKTCDLLLLDFQMPDYTGDQVLEFIRNKIKLKNLKIILLSGNEDCEKLLKAKSLSVNTIITKPFKFPELKSKILELIF